MMILDDEMLSENKMKLIANSALDQDRIKDKIYTIRGQQVMLDSDLADLYGTETKKLNQQVRRNIERFPDRYMFQLTSSELDILRSQIVTANLSKIRFMPYVFTEPDVAMLSSVLKSKIAIKVSLQVIDAFIAMRRFLASNALVFQRLDNVEKKLIEHDRKFDEVFNAIESKDLKPQKGIFFEGQVFDAHKFVSDLIRSARNSIILIDNYVDDTVLTLFCKRAEGVSVRILTKDISRQLELDLKKYNRQYPLIDVVRFLHSHDRFLIIDEKDVYHIGASLKDLGKKWCGFSRFEKETIRILDKIPRISTDHLHSVEKKHFL